MGFAEAKFNSLSFDCVGGETNKIYELQRSRSKIYATVKL